MEDYFADKKFSNIEEFESHITRELIDKYIESSREYMKKNEFQNNILYVVCQESGINKKAYEQGIASCF